MKLTVLGKYGPYPAANGATSGYLLQSGNENVLIECGSGVLSRLQRFVALNDLSAIVLSHLHSDHMADMLILRYALQDAPKSLKVFAPGSPALEADILRSCGAFDVTEITDGMMASVGAMKFEFTEMTHPVQSFGMRILADGRTLAYTGDTNWNDRVTAFARGCDTLLADTGLLSQSKPTPQSVVPHLTAVEVGVLAKNAGIKRLLCTHMSPKVQEEDVLREVREHFPDARIVRELETYEI